MGNASSSSVDAPNSRMCGPNLGRKSTVEGDEAEHVRFAAAPGFYYYVVGLSLRS